MPTTLKPATVWIDWFYLAAKQRKTPITVQNCRNETAFLRQDCRLAIRTGSKRANVLASFSN